LERKRTIHSRTLRWGREEGGRRLYFVGGKKQGKEENGIQEKGTLREEKQKNFKRGEKKSFSRRGEKEKKKMKRRKGAATNVSR